MVGSIPKVDALFKCEAKTGHMVHFWGLLRCYDGSIRYCILNSNWTIYCNYNFLSQFFNFCVRDFNTQEFIVIRTHFEIPISKINKIRVIVHYEWNLTFYGERVIVVNIFFRKFDPSFIHLNYRGWKCEYIGWDYNSNVKFAIIGFKLDYLDTGVLEN